MAGLLEDIKRGYRTGGPEVRLIYVNVAAFILSLVFLFHFDIREFIYPDWLALSSDFTVSGTRPWTFLTYGFLHSGFFHLLFNMMLLQFSGVLFATFFNRKQFYGLYFLSVIFSGIVFGLFYLAFGTTAHIVGASGAVMAVLVATATYSPDMRFRFMFIGTVRLWVLAAVFLGLDILFLFAENTGGHVAHLAGAFFGFIFVKLLQNGIDLSKPITFIIDFFANGFKLPQKQKFRKVHRNTQPQQPRSTDASGKNRTQQQIDEILDKISRSGYDSLSKEEKDFLFRAGNDK